MAKVMKDVQIHQLSKFFDHLVELIPAKFYNTNDNEQPDLKYMKKDARMAEKKARKIKAKAAKRARLDPDQAQTALSLQKQAPKTAGSDSDSDDSGDEKDGAAKEEHARDGEARPLMEVVGVGAQSKEPANTGKSIQLNDNTGNAPSMEDLKARLAKRLEVLRQERKAEAKKEQAQKAKQWREKALRQNKTKVATKRKASEALPEAETAQQSKQPAEPDVQLTFGQLVFNENEDNHKAKRQKKVTKAQMLDEAEKKAATKEKLSGSATGQEELQKQAWSAALLRARGEKILDDPKLLRKSLKKDEKLKKKKTAAWKERDQLQKKDTRDRQKKRKENLNKRVQDKQKRKIEKREKKLMRPGFEGRRDTAIN